MEEVECPICLEVVNPDNFPEIVKICKCNSHYHIECYRLLKGDRCQICHGSFIEIPYIEEDHNIYDTESVSYQNNTYDGDLPSYQEDQVNIVYEDSARRIRSPCIVCFGISILCCLVLIIPIMIALLY